MGKLRNRVLNTLGIVPRTAQTAARTTIDTTKTALNVALDPFIGIGKTGADIKRAVHKSFTEGPWYHKLWKVPASLALTPFMFAEGVVETLRGTGVNACSSVRDTIGNTLTNEGNAIKMMGKSEKLKFHAEEVEYKRISPKNRLAGLFKPKTEAEIQEKALKDKEKDLKAQEKKVKEMKEKETGKINSEKDKLKKDRESRESRKKSEEEKLTRERESWQNSKKAEEEKNLQIVKKEREGFNKERDDFKKRIAVLEQEKKDLESTLKATKTEKKESDIEDKEKKTEKKISKPEKEKKESGDTEVKMAA